MSISLLTATVASVLALASEVHAPIPQTPLWLSLNSPGFARDGAMERAAASQFGAERVVLAGAIPSRTTSVTVLAEISRTARSSAQWREALGEGRGNAFQVGVIACSEQRITLPGQGIADDFHGYVVSAGLCLDVHATSAALTGAGAPEFERSDFEKLLGALVISFPRRGSAANLSGAARELMHGALREPAHWSRWLDEQRRRVRDDATLEFVRGELGIFFNAKRELNIRAHRASLAAFAKLRTPSAQQRFAWMLAEESLGLGLHEAGQAAEACDALLRSFEIASQLKSPERAAIAYNLARACGSCAKPAEAVRYLNEAIAADPKFRGVAARDPAFETLAADKRFLALVRP